MCAACCLLLIVGLWFNGCCSWFDVLFVVRCVVLVARGLMCIVWCSWCLVVGRGLLAVCCLLRVVVALRVVVHWLLLL